MSWKPALSDDLIYDYEVGLSSTDSGIAPDIFPFKSSKHHNHFRINHPDIPGGKEFYVIIKTISKSGVEGIQVKPLFQVNIICSHLKIMTMTKITILLNSKITL